ncbi:MAG: ATP-grasp domain-containing protein [Methanospirillum sp.]
MSGRILVAGFATRHVAASACRAGYGVIAVDHFCDLDLVRVADTCHRFETLEELAAIATSAARENDVVGFLAGSGAETLALPVPLLGTQPAVAARFLDKRETQTFFETLGVRAPHPKPVGTYPAMAKPIHGSGGWRNAVVGSDDELAAWRGLFPDQPYLLQEVIEGVPASVSCIADGRRAVAVATNRQLLRGGTGMGYGFAGSVTPCDHPLAEEMAAIAETIAGASGCVGSLGIDFVLPREGEPVAIEVNPRFQGTLETVEAATGVNLVRLHLDACDGRLPDLRPEPQQYAARRILFADRDLVVGTDLSLLGTMVADIPPPGTTIPAGSAVVSVRATGRDEVTALALLDKHITAVRTYMERW